MSAFIQYTLQGLANGGFYALSALGLAVIFGVLGVVNFSHGACYMLGAVVAAILLDELGLGFWVGPAPGDGADVRVRRPHGAAAGALARSASTRSTTSC